MSDWRMRPVITRVKGRQWAYKLFWTWWDWRGLYWGLKWPHETPDGDQAAPLLFVWWRVGPFNLWRIPTPSLDHPLFDCVTGEQNEVSRQARAERKIWLREQNFRTRWKSLLRFDVQITKEQKMRR